MTRAGKPIGFLLLVTLLTACTPSPSPEQIRATAQVLAAERLAADLTARPTSTSEPTATLQPTQTPPPPSETTTWSPTGTATMADTSTPFGYLSPSDFSTAQANKADSNAPLVLDNRSGEVVRFVFLSPVYQEYEFSGSMSIIIPEAEYTYRIWIGKKGPINGSFAITNGDKHVLSIYVDKVSFKIP
jgi:hypothetical protein